VTLEGERPREPIIGNTIGETALAVNESDDDRRIADE
jgi:hypothetical protein